jgi:hypothetical protein
MSILNTVAPNLLTPAILFFVLGCLAGFLKSDLEIPDSISRYFSLYLILAIGFKGGVAISSTSDMTYLMLGTIATALAISFFQPFLGYGLLRVTTSISKPTAAAVAAHYGSVSIVTFATAIAFLKTKDTSYQGYIVAILALMEAPAILSALLIVHCTDVKNKLYASERPRLKPEIFTNASILLLLGAFTIGWITGQEGLQKVEGFLVLPFQGVLCFFLLDMGLLVAKNSHHLRRFTPSLVAFAFYMPLIGAGIGLLAAKVLHLDPGSGMLFMVLCASASYIAVPAAMRLSLPDAQASIYLPMALALTFPFNIIFGIPLYYQVSQRFLTSI